MANHAEHLLNYVDYKIALVCPLEVEMSAARYMLDIEHGRLPGKYPDTNQYIVGQMSGCNVVIASHPQGFQGNHTAATVAAHIGHTFPCISFRFLVGIGGGVPNSKDIRLGDVVVGSPENTHGGVIEYDLGRETTSGFQVKGIMVPPPKELLHVVTSIQSDHRTRPNKISSYLSEMIEKHPSLSNYERPSPQQDILFIPDNSHISGDNCDNCDLNRVVERIDRPHEPHIHYGLIASGNKVIKDASKRDILSRNAGGALCFEMEAAGLVNDFRCIVIRGISDYCDSHKNDKWHPYAAAAAAGFAKEIISYLSPVDSPQSLNPLIQQVPSLNDPDLKRCLQMLLVTDPEKDRQRILTTKDRLLKDCYSWILEDKELQTWRVEDTCQLLWLRGDAGKGKTMLMCALVEELPKILTNKEVLTFFFCQGTDNTLNNATGTLRGLIWKLATQRPQLAIHVLEEYKKSGGEKFLKGPNTLITLWSMLSNMIQDPNCSKVYLLIDALDECDHDLDQLLILITEASSNPSSKAKWLLASRNELYIKQYLSADGNKQNLSLELNQSHVSQAVEAYISYKTDNLARLKSYNDELKQNVRFQLNQKAESTFLWVALVCQRLEKVLLLSRVLPELEKSPPKLEALYARMVDRIHETDEKDLCEQILRAVVLAFRPLHLEELISVTCLPEEYASDISNLVDLCSSFVTVRDGIAYIVHQSAKDFFTLGRGKTTFASGLLDEHGKLVQNLLSSMARILKRDVCNLKAPSISLIEMHDLNITGPLNSVAYACNFWMNHLASFLEGDLDLHRYRIYLTDGGIVHKFLQEHLLHWLEAMSLLKNIHNGILALRCLESILKQDIGKNLFELTHDAIRFVLFNRSLIEELPLQTYLGTFSRAPEESVVRKECWSQIPRWARRVASTQKYWNALLQRLEGHTREVSAVAFSPDGRLLASGSLDSTIRLWDVATGSSQQQLEGHKRGVYAVAFSPNGRLLASGSSDKTIRLWDVATGSSQQQLEGHTRGINALAFSPNGRLLASGSSDKTIRLWDVSTGSSQQQLEGHAGEILAVAFSPDGRLLASGSLDSTIRLWDVATGSSQQQLEDHTRGVNALAFSPNGRLLASGSSDKTIRLWDVATGSSQQQLEGHTDIVYAVAFSPNGRLLASGSSDKTIRLWDVATGSSQQQQQEQLEGHTDTVHAVTFSPDGRLLTSGSWDKTIRLWDVATGSSQQQPEGHKEGVTAMAFSLDGRLLASGSSDKTIRLWDVATGSSQQQLEGHTDIVYAVAFSPDGRLLASGSSDKTIRLWDVATGDLHQTWKIKNLPWDLLLSRDGTYILTNGVSLLIEQPGLAAPKLKAPDVLYADKDWIMYESVALVLSPEKLIWDVHGNKIAVGLRSGIVTFMELDIEKADLENLMGE